MDVRNSVFIALWIMIVMQVLVPLALSVQILFSRRMDIFQRLSIYAFSTVYALFIYLMGNWSIVPYPLRYIVPAVIILSMVYSWWKGKPANGRGGAGYFLNISFYIFLALVFAYLDFRAVSGLKPDKPAVEFSFPLRSGFIYHGGNSPLLNYHNVDTTAQRYALDIVALNEYGTRAYGLYPKNLHKYAVFEDTVFSPCDCMVLHAVDTLSDMAPGIMDTSNPAGNHLILRMDSFLVVLAHLRQNSVMVRVGDSAFMGQSLALVGNSGNTSEPHLHMHVTVGGDVSDAMRGRGVPIAFGGKFPVRNDVFRGSFR